MIKLTETELDVVKKILATQCPHYEVWAFGSRVHGQPHLYSDLDLVIKSPSPLDWKKIEAIKQAFSESTLPFSVDIVDWNAISEDFKNIIEKGYVVLQEK